MAIDEIAHPQAARPAPARVPMAEPAVSFGYFGEYEAVQPVGPAALSPVAGPAAAKCLMAKTSPTRSSSRAASLLALPVRESYRVLHEAVAALHPWCHAGRRRRPGECRLFRPPVVADVIHAGRKIAGAAQRRGTFGSCTKAASRELPGQTASPNPSPLLSRESLAKRDDSRGDRFSSGAIGWREVRLLTPGRAADNRLRDTDH